MIQQKQWLICVKPPYQKSLIAPIYALFITTYLKIPLNGLDICAISPLHLKMAP